ncbi:MAG: hypothetical protein K0Q90_3434 [Paenibacillaceae bacterium]|jgi:hypothetical protein|nr:hypothetical protein [Paenibacillaceae bacterium]
MIVHMHKWIERMKFIVLFFVLVILLYHIMAVVGQWMQPAHRHRTPEGSAVKAFRQDSGTLYADNMADRLRLFYWLGE